MYGSLDKEGFRAAYAAYVDPDLSLLERVLDMLPLLRKLELAYPRYFYFLGVRRLLTYAQAVVMKPAAVHGVKEEPDEAHQPDTIPHCIPNHMWTCGCGRRRFLTYAGLAAHASSGSVTGPLPEVPPTSAPVIYLTEIN